MAVDLTQPIKLGSPDYVEQQVIRKLDALGTAVSDPLLADRVAQVETDIDDLESEAVLETDTSTSAMQFVVDEDDMSSDSATKIPTQQSVKAYVDNNAGGLSEAEVDARVVAVAGDSLASFTLETPLQSDDTAYSYSFGQDRIGSLIVTTNVSGEYAILGFRARTSSVFCYVITASSDFAATTGILAGTTGADTKSTISVHTNNTLYVENRRGSPRQYAVAVNYRS